MWIRAFIAVAVLQIALAFCSSVARAENYALLIGASGYPAPIPALHGPVNDMLAMWGILTERGFKRPNIRILADGLPDGFAREASVDCGSPATGPSCPLYANITRALSELVTRAKAGDYVALHFSGHGVQVPDLVKRDEPDGLNEAFVPLDVGRWNAKRREVDNLLIDDTLGDAIEKIRGKGAFVWAIIDTCHAGDMVRGATSYGVPRMVRGDALGIPDQAYAEATKAKPVSRKRKSSLNLLKTGRSDGLVGFYAAQSDQLALELAFQEQDASGNAATLVMGALTNAVRRALAQEPNATYRELAQRVVEIYGNLGSDMPAPYFEGDLDKPVFSDKATEPIWQANERAGKLVIAAGELNGLSEGAIVAVLDPAGDGTAATALGYARVERASASRSEAMPVAYADKKPFPLAGRGRLRARIEQPGIRAVLRVALPPAGDAATAAPESSGRAAIELLRDTPPEKRAMSVEWVEATLPADAYLRLRDGRIWLLTPFGHWVRSGARQSPSIAVAEREATAKALLDNLWRSARALNLQRVEGSYRQSIKGSEGAVAKALNVELFLYRDPLAAPDRPACPAEPAGKNALPKGAVRIAADAVSEFRHCDIVYAVMRNTGTQPADVTLLYLDADAQIQCFNGWGKARIDPGEVLDRIQAFRIVTMDPRSGATLPIGRERLMVIGVEKASRDAIETTFCHLQQKSLDTARQERNKRGGNTSAFAALMEDAGLATEPTRGLGRVSAEEFGAVVMRTFTWDVKDAPKP
jgi:hypothetical protein